MAAAVAAVGLHALLFSLLPSGHQSLAVIAPEGSLQVELMKLPSPRSEKAEPSETQAHKLADATSPSATVAPRQHKPVQQMQKPVLLAVPAMHTSPAQQAVAVLPLSGAIKKQSAEAAKSILAQAASHTIALNSNTPSETDAVNQGATIVPSHFQQQILARVTYPKRARRYGWQGRTELEFKVLQQTVFEITMLASSGHPILDRAARYGLATVGTIPLSNGLYRMPVEFRLQ